MTRSDSSAMAGVLSNVGMGAARRHKRGLRIRILVSVVCLLVLGPATATASGPPVVEIIRSKMETLRSTGNLPIGKAAVAATKTLPIFYEQRHYRPAWTRKKTVNQLFRAVEDAAAEGLDPGDYHFATLKAVRRRFEAASPADPHTLADTDILLTDSLMRLTYHLLFGKVDPQGLNPYLNLVES